MSKRSEEDVKFLLNSSLQRVCSKSAKAGKVYELQSLRASFDIVLLLYRLMKITRFQQKPKVIHFPKKQHFSNSLYEDWGICAVSDTVRHASLLRYWSSRYFLMISISIAVTSISSLSIIWAVATYQQNSSLEAMARDIAAMAVDNGGTLPEGPALHNTLEDMVGQHGLSGKPILFILDKNGAIVQQHPPDPPDGTRQIDRMLPEILTGSAHVFKLKTAASAVPYMVAVQPMIQEPTVTGYVLYFEKRQTKLKELFFNSPRLTLLCTILLIGWGIVYLMTRRLVRPIRQVAGAAKQVVAGNYEININKEYKEAEIYELTHSFNEMADRLARLEALRSQLLVGVTNELKAPVVSINRMIQAVKNSEVSEEEADAYLEASLKESLHLQKMIENLLEFNRCITGEVSVTWESCDLDALITEIIDRWKFAQNDRKLKVVKETANDRDGWKTWTDPARLEQILVNLLNNAKDAMPAGGTVRVLLMHPSEEMRIQVQDTGRGIPREEYDNVFEPFYRGGDHKTHVRGLGIGLAFSRLIARSLGGELVLSDGTPGKTTFTLILSSDRMTS